MASLDMCVCVYIHIYVCMYIVFIHVYVCMHVFTVEPRLTDTPEKQPSTILQMLYLVPNVLNIHMFVYNQNPLNAETPVFRKPNRLLSQQYLNCTKFTRHLSTAFVRLHVSGGFKDQTLHV